MTRMTRSAILKEFASEYLVADLAPLLEDYAKSSVDDVLLSGVLDLVEQKGILMSCFNAYDQGFWGIYNDDSIVFPPDPRTGTSYR